MKYVKYIILSVLLSLQPLLAGGGNNISKTGMSAASFLEIGVGARALGMGGAFVGIADDASALYWNPGGLSVIPRPEFIFMHSEWLAEMDYDYLGLVLPLGGAGAFGLSLSMLSMADMEVTNIDYPEGTGEFFAAADLAIAASYGISLTDRFSFGLSAKYVQQKIWKETAQGMAVDLGTLFNTRWHNLRIGAALTNFGSDMRMAGDDLLIYYDLDETKAGNNERTFAELKTDSWPMPLTFQAGVAIDPVHTQKHRLTLAVDAVHPSDNTESVNLGAEYALQEWFFLRAGYRDLFLEEAEAGPTAGGGLMARFMGFSVKMDYAYADFGRLENVHRFAISLGF